MLGNVVYLDPSDWLDYRMAPGLIAGKSLDINGEEGQRISRWLREAASRQAGLVVQPPTVAETPSPGYITANTKVRLGQGSFRIIVLDAYQRKCCVTGERALPAIEAAHIQPFAETLDHGVQNGLLLRADMHGLFDSGYLTVDEKYRVVVSRRLRDDFDNGREYYPFHGKPIALPKTVGSRPSLEALEWHRDNRFFE